MKKPFKVIIALFVVCAVLISLFAGFKILFYGITKSLEANAPTLMRPGPKYREHLNEYPAKPSEGVSDFLQSQTFTVGDGDKSYEFTYNEIDNFFEAQSPEMKKNTVGKFAEGVSLFYSEHPENAPKDGYDIEKCMSDEWYYYATVYAFLLDVPFDEAYEKSLTDNGKIELLNYYLSIK